jgi:hypothetical protein
VTVRRGRRHRQLLGGIKEKKGYFIFKDEALYCSLRRTSIGKAMDLSLGRLRNEWMNELIN